MPSRPAPEAGRFIRSTTCSRAFSALQGAYDKAIKANGGKWPTREQVIDAAAGLEFKGWGRNVTLRPDDNHGLEAQLVGVTRTAPGYDFKVLDNMMLFDPKAITTPAGMKSGGLAENPDARFREDGRADFQARQLT